MRNCTKWDGIKQRFSVLKWMSICETLAAKSLVVCLKLFCRIRKDLCTTMPTKSKFKAIHCSFNTEFGDLAMPSHSTDMLLCCQTQWESSDAMMMMKIACYLSELAVAMHGDMMNLIRNQRGTRMRSILTKLLNLICLPKIILLGKT